MDTSVLADDAIRAQTVRLSLKRTPWTRPSTGEIPRPVYPRRRVPALTGVSTGRPPESSPHLHLLEVARSLGHVDGGLAARIDPAGSMGPQPTCCRGREPEEFARHLWADRPGAPPSGPVLNAPLWYAAGFAEALTAERAGHRQPPPWPRPRTSPGATPRSAAALLPRRRCLDRPLPRPAPPAPEAGQDPGP